MVAAANGAMPGGGNEIAENREDGISLQKEQGSYLD